MSTHYRRLMPVCLLLVMLISAIPLGSAWAQVEYDANYPCPTTSTNSYLQAPVRQYDQDNPVRPAWNHADKNLALRSYSLTNALKDFVVYTTPDPTTPPQFATIFAPDRAPTFTNVYRIYNWNWAPSPNEGTRGDPVTTYPVTALGLSTVPGEILQSPSHGYDISPALDVGGVMVLFATPNSVTLVVGDADSAAVGYTVHIVGICTDPELLELYTALDNPEGPRYDLYGFPPDGNYDYNLPALNAGTPIGRARSEQIVVAIADTGSFQDPRSRDDFWIGYNTHSNPPKVFNDVPVVNKEWMQIWIEKFYQNGITSGCGVGPLIYCPEANVTRAEMAVFVLRAKHYPNLPHTPPNASGTFDDVPVEGKEWMEKWIEEFYTLGITTGCGTDPLIYCPEQPVTRAEMAVFILRALEGGSYTPPAASGFFDDVPVGGKEWMEAWIDEFYRRGITSGCGQAPLTYCPEQLVTRGEMAVFILRAFSNLPQP